MQHRLNRTFVEGGRGEELTSERGNEAEQGIKFRQSGVPTRASSSRRISKLCNLSRVDPD